MSFKRWSINTFLLFLNIVIWGNAGGLEYARVSLTMVALYLAWDLPFSSMPWKYVAGALSVPVLCLLLGYQEYSGAKLLILKIREWRAERA